MMNLKDRIEAFARIGQFISRHYGTRLDGEAQLHAGLEQVIELAYHSNGWFSPNNVNEAIRATGAWLDEQSLRGLCAKGDAAHPKTVAVICAGNIPLVGFHDLLCVLLSGHKLLLRLSTDDNVLLPFFIRMLVHYEPRFEHMIRIADARLTGFDAVIATGSNNTARHFEYYFGKYPSIIRRNRSSLAVLEGNETSGELSELGKDIFLYYGLGCRNVSKLLVPQAYNFDHFFQSIVSFSYVIDNKKYANNYDYHRAIYLLDSETFLDNNFLMIKQSESLHSPVATLYYQYYDSPEQVQAYLKTHENEIQCVIGHGFIPFGYSQRPVITDFADNINTWDFLVSL